MKLHVFSMRMKAGGAASHRAYPCATQQLRHVVGEALDIGSLSAYERPLPTMIEYDQLFSASTHAVQG